MCPADTANDMSTISWPSSPTVGVADRSGCCCCCGLLFPGARCTGLLLGLAGLALASASALALALALLLPLPLAELLEAELRTAVMAPWVLDAIHHILGCACIGC